MHFVTRATPMDDMNGKSHKMELKYSHDYSTNCIKSKSCHCLFMAQGHTHTHTDTHTFMDKSDFKKSGTPTCGRRTPGLKTMEIN